MNNFSLHQRFMMAIYMPILPSGKVTLGSPSIPCATAKVMANGSNMVVAFLISSHSLPLFFFFSLSLRLVVALTSQYLTYHVVIVAVFIYSHSHNLVFLVSSSETGSRTDYLLVVLLWGYSCSLYIFSFPTILSYSSINLRWVVVQTTQ